MNTLKNALTIALLSLIFTSSCNKENLDINNKDEFDEYINDELDFQEIPALSVLIFKENDILHEAYYGKSNIAQDLDLQNNHLFMLASISKVITATALLQLYDDGLFALNDPINDYLPFSVNVPNETREITFEMLLTHTSAIADGSALDDQYYYGQDSPVELGFFLENYLVLGGDFYNANENYSNFTPGTDYEYSNIGNALIALLVEEISGRDFNNYCKQEIFSPLGMTNTHWRLDEITQSIVTPYTYSNNGHNAIQNYTFTDYPNGGLRSTGIDLHKFLQAFVQNGQANNYQLLEGETIDLMPQPQIPSIDNEVGLHLFLLSENENLWGHDGGEEGVATIMAFNKTSKVGAIILANEGDADLDEILEQAYKLGLKL